MLVISMFVSCGRKKDNYRLDPGLVDSETESDGMDVVIGDETTGTSNKTVITDQTSIATTTTKPKTSQNTNVLMPPGDKVKVDPNEIKLPKYNITNKTVKLLTRHDPPTEKVLSLLKSEYGITVETRFEPVNQINQVLISLIKSGKSPDLFSQDFSPTFLTRDYIQEMGKDIVDFDSALWKGVKDTNMLFTVDGKVCYVAPVFPKYLVVWYNKKMFVDAGLKTPMQLFNEGKWDWNAFASVAKKLTVDSNRDGTPEIYGYGWDAPELLLYTTGKHFISYNPNGKAINNLRSVEIARYMAWVIDFVKKVKQYPNNARLDLPQGKLAMVVGHIWYGSGYGPQIKSGMLEFAPLPKDPNADKYYVAASASGFMIPKNAQNVAGAAAFLSVQRYVFVHPNHFSTWYDEMQEKYGWTNPMKEVFRKQNEINNDVLMNWMYFNIGQYWGQIFHRPVAEGIPWSTIVEEVAPLIDYQIKAYYENQSL